MANSHSSIAVPAFNGEVFEKWTQEMKRHLIRKGLWNVIEPGLKHSYYLLNRIIPDEEMAVLKQNKMNDFEAMLEICKSLPPRLSLRLYDAKTAKEAWAMLHEDFQMNEPDQAQEGPSAKRVRRIDPTESQQTTKLHFSLFLTRTSVPPTCVLQFPLPVAPLLPSTNMTSTLKCASGETYQVQFFGKRKQKVLGAGWRRFVIDHNLKDNDKVRIDVMKNSSEELELKIKTPKRCKCRPAKVAQEQIMHQADNNDDEGDAAIIITDDEDDDEETISDNAGEEDV